MAADKNNINRENFLEICQGVVFALRRGDIDSEYTRQRVVRALEYLVVGRSVAIEGILRVIRIDERQREILATDVDVAIKSNTMALVKIARGDKPSAEEIERTISYLTFIKEKRKVP
jgi:hypothetical protein